MHYLLKAFLSINHTFITQKLVILLHIRVYCQKRSTKNLIFADPGPAPKSDQQVKHLLYFSYSSSSFSSSSFTTTAAQLSTSFSLFLPFSHSTDIALLGAKIFCAMRQPIKWRLLLPCRGDSLFVVVSFRQCSSFRPRPKISRS